MFHFLYLIPANEDDSLETWRNAVTTAAKNLNDLLDLEINKIKESGGSLSTAISLITVLSFLASDELDTYLRAVVDGDWIEMKPLFQKYASQWCIASPLEIAFEEPPAQEEDFFGGCGFMQWEEWREHHLNQQLTLFHCACSSLKVNSDRTSVKIFSTRDKRRANNIILEINPFCGLDEILISVKEHLKTWRDDFIQEVGASWENEHQQGFVDDDFIEYEKIAALVSTGDKLAFKGNIKARACHTTLKEWQKAIRTFDLLRHGFGWRDIVVQPWWTGRTDENAAKWDIPKDKKIAKKILSLVLKGQPLTGSMIRMS